MVRFDFERNYYEPVRKDGLKRDQRRSDGGSQVWTRLDGVNGQTPGFGPRRKLGDEWTAVAD